MSIDKNTGTVKYEKYHHKNTTLYTASMMKVVFAWFFLEYCYEELNNTVSILDEYKEVWWVLDSVKNEDTITYNALILLMIVISDNTATNIIYKRLTEKLWDLSAFIGKKFQTYSIQVFDLMDSYSAEYWSWQSNPYEFMKLLQYFFYEFKHSNYLKEILSKQYIKWRGLRYLDVKNFVSAWNKTGQIDLMINDCWFIETADSFMIYTVFCPADNIVEFLYDVENKIYKKIGRIVYKHIHPLLQ